MPTDRIARIRELSTVLNWLRRRYATTLATRTKYEKFYVESPNQTTQAVFNMHDKRARVISWLVSTVELDLKTLASNGKAPGTKGANRK